MITYSNKLDMTPGGFPCVINLNQYDDDVELQFLLHSRTGLLTIQTGTTAMIRGTKRDGNAYSADATINVSSSTVTVAVTKQMTAAAGKNVFELVLLKGTKVLSTANFILQVEHAAMDADTVTSESVLKEMNALIESASTAKAAAEEATEAAQSVSASAAQIEANRQAIAENASGIAENTTAVADLKDDISKIIPGLSDEAKNALLACFRGVAWLNWEEDGKSLYNTLAETLDIEPAPEFEYGVYTPEAVINGKYIDDTGNVVDGVSGQSFYINDYIPAIRTSYWIGLQPPDVEPIKSGTAYTGVRSESNWRISEYDVNKNFIKQTHYAIGDLSVAYSSNVISFDSATKYIRLGWYDKDGTKNVFDIENPTEIVPLQMELGGINASTGLNEDNDARIRTIGFVEIENEKITLTGCPFAPTWQEFSFVPDNYGFYVVRCYDANKNFVGTTGAKYADVINESLPSGTKYIRLIMQYAAQSFANYQYCSSYIITINGTRYYITT